MEGLNNIERWYRARAIEAIEAFNSEDFDTCDRLCVELLSEPDLPMLWRAEANFMLGTSEENTALPHATEAVRLYTNMLREEPDSVALLEALRLAERSLQNVGGAREVNTAADTADEEDDDEEQDDEEESSSESTEGSAWEVGEPMPGYSDDEDDDSGAAESMKDDAEPESNGQKMPAPAGNDRDAGEDEDTVQQ